MIKFKLNSFSNNNDATSSFWNWFVKNSKHIYHFEKNQNAIFKSIKCELNKIDSNLVFEFSPILPNGKRKFVISADGIINSFPAVEKIVNKAPTLNDWEIVAFRQPNKGINEISVGKTKANFDNIFFKYQKNVNNIDVLLYLPNFMESAEWSMLSFLILDIVLGEYDTEMYINRIDKKILDKETKDLIPIKRLPDILNQLKLEFSN